MNHLKELEGAAIAVFHGAQDARKRLSRYESKATIAKADRAVSDANDLASAAADRVGEILSRINQMKFVELEPLIQRLNELVAAEAELNHAVTGQSYTTALGIVVPPRSAA
jgi:hypothetical protein